MHLKNITFYLYFFSVLNIFSGYLPTARNISYDDDSEYDTELVETIEEIIREEEME